MIRFSITLLAFCFFGVVTGQNGVSKEISSLVAAGQQLSNKNVLRFQSNDLQQRDLHLEGLRQGTILTLDQELLQQLVNGQTEKDFIQIQLPVTERTNVQLVLKRHEIFTADFALFSSANPTRAIEYTPGLHYKGIVEGDPTSIVALTMYGDEIMAIISTDQGNAVIGRIKDDNENRHIFYFDKDLDRTSGFECETPDDGLGYTEEQLKSVPSTRDLGDCVRLYIEIDDDIVTQKGGATPATNYITGLFNQVIVLYNNESINMMINEILAWTTPAPYAGGTSSAMLSSYQNNTGSFNGNLSHLVSYQASGGIAAGFSGICNSNPDLSKCFSSIDGVYSNVPTYSWDVMVTTHEMGHLIGSRHTHACVWNGNNTAIDGCSGSVEGSCPLPGIPSGGGTMMSYCHLQNVGINFNLGFGTQPGDVIRNSVNGSGNCLTACGPPPPPSYCASSGTNTTDEWINNVTLGSINNTSGNNGGYANYTALSTTLNAGTAYTINLAPAFSGPTYLEYWSVWIDYNGDLDWADAGEQVAQGSGTAAINVNFTVPSGATPLTTRLRVSMQYNASPPVCGTFTWGEVEDYTVVISGGSSASCTDGIQNQGETGVDCGGPCPACPTCNDGIQNQGETGVDCGGPCPACPGGGETILLASYFEAGWDSWADGGSDVTRVNSANSWEGIYSIRLADNSGTQSAMTSPAFNMAGATGAEIEFYFYASSMEVGEDFWVRYNNGSGYTTIASYARGTNFNNNTFYVATVVVPNFSPTTGTFRIQCDASDNNDQIFIDQVTITKFTGSNLIEPGMRIEEVQRPNVLPNPLSQQFRQDAGGELLVYPNPVNDLLNISFSGEIRQIKVMSLDGLEIKVPGTSFAQKHLDIHALAPGIYFLWVLSENKWIPTRFSKM